VCSSRKTPFARRHCADHAWLQVVEDHVIRKTADVQFGVMMTVRIAATDEQPASTVTSHVGQRHGLCRGAKGSGSSRASLIKAWHKPASIGAFPDILFPFRYSPCHTLR
jgi:hypothetical protein